MAITATTSVLTGNDWKYAKDIRPGDWVFNRFGKPVKVKLAQMYRSEDCYRVTFDDYLSIEGDSQQAFPVEDMQYRKHALNYKGVRPHFSKPKRYTGLEMQEKGLVCRRSRTVFSVPTTEPIQFPHQPLGIPPFIFGFWFMSRKSEKTMTIPPEFKDMVLQKFKDAGYKITEKPIYHKKYYQFTTTPSIWSQLAGQMPTKIPLAYLNGSPEQRLELIQGILAAKPLKKSTRCGYFKFKSRKKHISAAFQYVSETLGATSSLTHDVHAKTYDVNVHRLKPFLPEMAPPRAIVHFARRYVKSIEPIPAQLCVHIETDEENGTFLVGEGFIPCH